MKQLQIGIVGVGFIGERHIDAISRIPGARIAAVADTDARRARKTAEQIGAELACTTVGEMLEKADVDVVHNCTPTNMHYPVAAEVIKAGKALYCEKPLAMTAREGEALLALLREHPVPNAVNLNYRMNAIPREIRERLCGPGAGRTLMVSGSYIQDWMLKQDDCDWRLDPQIGGASRAVADIGSHLFDIAQFILGKRISAVNCEMSIAYGSRLKYQKTDTFSKEKGALIGEIPVRNEDAAMIMARFEDGTPALFQVSQISAGHKNDLRIRVDSTDCSYEWRQENSDLLLIGRRDEPNQILYREASALHPSARAYSALPSGHPEGWNDALCHAVQAFYETVSRPGGPETPAFATVEDGVWLLRIVDACLKSNELKRWVSVADGRAI